MASAPLTSLLVAPMSISTPKVLYFFNETVPELPKEGQRTAALSRRSLE